MIYCPFAPISDVFLSPFSDLTEVNRIQEIMTESYDKLKNTPNDETSLNGSASRFENDLSKLKLDDPKEVATLIENYCVDFDTETEENSDNESVDSSTSKGISLYLMKQATSRRKIIFSSCRSLR